LKHGHFLAELFLRATPPEMLAAPAIIKRILIDPLLEALGTELHLGIIRKTAAEPGTD